jgi:hypothetical protein
MSAFSHRGPDHVAVPAILFNRPGRREAADILVTSAGIVCGVGASRGSVATAGAVPPILIPLERRAIRD